MFELDSDLVTGPRVPGAPTEPVLRIHEIQGHVMPGLNTAHLQLLGLRFDGERGVDAIRSWLGTIAPRIATLARAVEHRNERRRALRRNAPPPVTPPLLAVALSVDGLRCAVRNAGEIRDAAFQTGMYNRSSLGDPPLGIRGALSTWTVGGTRETTPHVLLIIGADDLAELEGAAQTLRIEAERDGATIIYAETGHALPRGTEHFGFRDGVSQPGVRGRLSDLPNHFLTRRYIHPDDPLAITHSRPGQPLVWPGQFVFGYPTQDRTDGVYPLDPPSGPDWLRDGSLLVFRRLQQDVAAFRNGIVELRGQIRNQIGLDLSNTHMAALLVGRWPRGTALTRNPDNDEVAPMAHSFSVNHFSYAQRTWPVQVADDRWVELEELRPKAGQPERFSTVEGVPGDDPATRCPAFAHIRKVNPRDLTTDQGDEADTLMRLVLRRGITYGSPYPDDPDERVTDDGDRGLLFLAYQSSIVEQFETLNTRWMNRSGAPEAPAGHDMLVGQAHGQRGRHGELTIAHRTLELEPSGSWVFPAGGGYFFAPSVSALRTFGTHARR